MNIDASKATIISICPFPINEYKPGLIPSRYEIPAAKENDIELLVIPSTIIYRQRIPIVGNVIDISVPATQVAESIINDRLTGQLFYSETARPGLFWVPGEYAKHEANALLKKEISLAKTYQDNWYLELVKAADDDWNKYHQHGLITSIQRSAAKSLNLTRDWVITTSGATVKTCLACFSPIHPQATICAVCRTNQEEFAKVKK